MFFFFKRCYFEIKNIRTIFSEKIIFRKSFQPGVFLGLVVYILGRMEKKCKEEKFKALHLNCELYNPKLEKLSTAIILILVSCKWNWTINYLTGFIHVLNWYLEIYLIEGNGLMFYLKKIFKKRKTFSIFSLKNC